MAEQSLLLLLLTQSSLEFCSGGFLQAILLFGCIPRLQPLKKELLRGGPEESFEIRCKLSSSQPRKKAFAQIRTHVPKTEKTGHEQPQVLMKHTKQEALQLQRS